MRLATKFLLAFVAASVIAVAASGYFRVLREIDSFDADMRQDATAYASTLSHAVGESASRDQAQRLVRRSNERAPHLRARWVGLDGGSLDTPLAPPDVLEPLRRGHTVSWVRHDDGGAGDLVTYVALERDPPSTHAGVVEVSESLEPRRRFVRASVQSTAVTMAIAFCCMSIVAVVLGVVLVGRPLRAVGEKVRRIGAGDLGPPLLLAQRDEIGNVARELNAMCEQLAEGRRRLDIEIAARITALEQLRHADRLATVGRLASGIAHEIGTPLAVVAGRSKLIASGEATGADAASNARIVHEQTQHISTIIRQLLDFARRRPAQRAEVDLAELGRKTALLLEPIAAKRRVTLNVNAPEPVRASVDAGQIQQALTNLMMNAIQASAPGAGVELAIDGDAAGGATLAVSDSGSGMDAATLAHVFEPFFTTKDVGEGTGLGLPVAYGLVREHGGRIDVESQVGRGSRFVMFLPAPAESAP